MTYPFPPRSNLLTNQIRFNATDFEPLLDSIEAAALLRIHPKTLQKMARRGDIQGRHVGKCWRFRASDLNEWLWRQERAVSSLQPLAR
jgi:excisionase family DNA binding protein